MNDQAHWLNRNEPPAALPHCTSSLSLFPVDTHILVSSASRLSVVGQMALCSLRLNNCSCCLWLCTQFLLQSSVKPEPTEVQRLSTQSDNQHQDSCCSAVCRVHMLSSLNAKCLQTSIKTNIIYHILAYPKTLTVTIH